METSHNGYDFKPLEEALWVAGLAVSGAVVSYLSGLDLSQGFDLKVVYPALTLVAGRALIGGLRAGIPKVLPKTTPEEAITIDQIAALMDKKLEERLGPPSGLILPGGGPAPTTSPPLAS